MKATSDTSVKDAESQGLANLISRRGRDHKSPSLSPLFNRSPRPSIFQLTLLHQHEPYFNEWTKAIAEINRKPAKKRTIYQDVLKGLSHTYGLSTWQYTILPPTKLRKGASAETVWVQYNENGNVTQWNCVESDSKLVIIFDIDFLDDQAKKGRDGFIHVIQTLRHEYKHVEQHLTKATKKDFTLNVDEYNEYEVIAHAAMLLDVDEYSTLASGLSLPPITNVDSMVEIATAAMEYYYKLSPAKKKTQTDIIHAIEMKMYATLSLTKWEEYTYAINAINAKPMSAPQKVSKGAQKLRDLLRKKNPEGAWAQGKNQGNQVGNR